MFPFVLVYARRSCEANCYALILILALNEGMYLIQKPEWFLPTLLWFGEGGGQVRQVIGNQMQTLYRKHIVKKRRYWGCHSTEWVLGTLRLLDIYSEMSIDYYYNMPAQHLCWEKAAQKLLLFALCSVFAMSGWEKIQTLALAGMGNVKLKCWVLKCWLDFWLGGNCFLAVVCVHTFLEITFNFTEGICEGAGAWRRWKGLW